MKIKSIKIENFKAIKSLTIICNDSLNAFSGINNSGKTTILEAISLWSECYEKLKDKAQQTNNNAGYNKNQHKLGIKSGKEILKEEIYSIRIVEFEEIFHNLDTNSEIEISLTFEHNNMELEIPFMIKRKSKSSKTYNIKLSKYEIFKYDIFNTYFENMKKPLNVFFAPPLNRTVGQEMKLLNTVVNYKVKSQNSEEVFMNRINNLTPEDREKLEKSLMLVLKLKNIKIVMDSLDEVNHRVKLKINDEVEKNISLYGSGTLHLINLLLSVYESKSDLNLVLLDEPGSHLHREALKNLLMVLKEENGIQTFMTTHNIVLLKELETKELFNIDDLSKEKKLTCIIDKSYPEEGIEISPKKELYKVVDGGKNYTGYDFMEALEADKIIFVEGKGDAELLEVVFKTTINTSKEQRVYWIVDGIDNILKKLPAFKEIFSSIKNGKTLWEKSVLFIDKDYLVEKKRVKLSKDLESKQGIKNYITSTYSIEGLFLKEPEKLSEILSEILSKTKELILKELTSLIEKKVIFYKENIMELDSEMGKWIGQKKEVMNKISNNLFKSDYNSANLREEIIEKNEYENLINKDNFNEILKEICGKEIYINSLLEKMTEKNIKLDIFEEIKEALKL